MCRLIVRAAVDFLRGAWPFFDGACLVLLEVLLDFVADFFLGEAELLLCDEDELWADNPLPCTISRPASMVEVTRLRHIGGISLTRLDALLFREIGC